jgi:hypothetical protein
MKKLSTLFTWLGLATSAVTGVVAAAGREPILIVTLDAPVSFGYKVSWLAIKSEHSQAVVHALGLQEPRPANWASGIETAYSRGEPGSTQSLVFVSPPIDGWVLVVGSGLPLPDHHDPKTQGAAEVDPSFDVLFAALAKQFPEVQFFSSYRVVGLAAWARARAGRIERIFCYADGEVYANTGPQTAEEKALKFLDLSGLSPLSAREAIYKNAEQRNAQEDRLVAGGMDRLAAQRKALALQRTPIPDEDDPMVIAAAWSLNPNALEERHLPPSVGTIGRLVAAKRSPGE